jgi:hypothetical protein
MTTPEGAYDDTLTVRRRFLAAVASARKPVRAKDLKVPGLDRRTIQKRLERLRRAPEGGALDDDALIAFARRELTRIGDPVQRGSAKLHELADPAARAFAEAAGLQTVVVGDWVEFAHSPGDQGWSRREITVQPLARGSAFVRGRSQGWLTEKKAFLREAWLSAQADPALMRALVPNGLKADLARLIVGTTDSPRCAIQVAELDWLTCVALNSRLDEPLLSEPGATETIRGRWCDPRRVVERRGLPGMLVAHIIVMTSDRRFLVCQRQLSGIQDEPGRWSLSIEERWSAPPPKQWAVGSHGSHEDSDFDRHPHDAVRRGLREELGIAADDAAIRVLSWGIETSVLYPGFIALAKVEARSWEVEGLRAHAADASELRFVTSIPADLSVLSLLTADSFAPDGRPGLEAPWHRTAKARLFAAIVCLASEGGAEGRAGVLAKLGRLGV